MQLQNYYYWFKDAIPHHVCDDIVRYAKSIQDQMAALMSGIQLAPAQTMGNLGQYLSAAYGSPSSTTYQQSPSPSTLQTLLGGGVGLAGIIGALRDDD